jgi:hypothetical protein
MMNPISSAVAAAQHSYGVAVAANKQPQQKPQATDLPQDKVTLSSAATTGDHDGDKS